MNVSVVDILENLRKENEKMKSWSDVVRDVRNEVYSDGYSDVGDRADIRLGCTRAMLDAVILEMILKGYRYKVEEIERDGKRTRTYVLKKVEFKNDESYYYMRQMRESDQR